MARFLFPKIANKARPSIVLLSVVTPVYAVALVWYAFSPKTHEVNYAPAQPIPFSHALHAGELGMDCRYCHHTVERTGVAAIPSTQSCMSCHHSIKTDSPDLRLLYESDETGKPIEWVRVHDLPDYAYFDHSAHVLAGVACSSCHGRVDKMEKVMQVEPLSMAWCLECHRNPEPHIRPPEYVTVMEWESILTGEKYTYTAQELPGVIPSQDCSACHR